MANETISDKIYSQLSASILAGEIAPGQKLEEQDIADQYGVSRTPIREAFRLLDTAGLVESKAHRGVTVIDLDVDQIADMYEALEEIEAICARLSAERMTAVERKQVMRIHEESELALKADDVDTFAELNDKFHSAIHRGAKNQTIQQSINRLRKRLMLFRHPWLFRQRDRLPVSFAEHKALAEAIQQGDKNAAFDAMRNHISNTSLITIEYFANKQN